MSYDTTTLLGVIQGLRPQNTFLIDLLCPAAVTFGTKEIDFDKLTDEYKLAPFVSPVVAGKANVKAGALLQKFSPAYVKPKDVIDPERVLKRLPGEGIGGTLTPAQRADAIRADIIDDQRKRIRRREEWMLAQLLRTGKVVVAGENYPSVEVDFGRTGTLTKTLSSDARWSESASTPNDDLEAWMGLVDAPTTHIIMGRGAYRKYINHASTEKLINTQLGSDTKLDMAPAQMFASYKGRLGSAGPEIWTYSGWYHDDTGAKTLYIADNQVVLVSTGAAGVRAYGAILDGASGYAEAELFPKNWTENDPPVEYIMTQSAPLPVIPLINSTLCANVYTL
ncbi:MAG TPA: major capsid protein [Hyphomicrobiales bacterium]|nr:major capsid protein [Hyphomicrobiales bacterium]